MIAIHLHLAKSPYTTDHAHPGSSPLSLFRRLIAKMGRRKDADRHGLSGGGFRSPSARDFDDGAFPRFLGPKSPHRPGGLCGATTSPARSHETLALTTPLVCPDGEDCCLPRRPEWAPCLPRSTFACFKQRDGGRSPSSWALALGNRNNRATNQKYQDLLPRKISSEAPAAAANGDAIQGSVPRPRARDQPNLAENKTSSAAWEE